ncbi:hypothetical protein B0H14DRAFT_2572784 [Mycena olivaceomarginata]|nr:hypothetical protein B0H14DRAFT_2572784 [Mycena olivaceomarginata]
MTWDARVSNDSNIGHVSGHAPFACGHGDASSVACVYGGRDMCTAAETSRLPHTVWCGSGIGTDSSVPATSRARKAKEKRDDERVTRNVSGAACRRLVCRYGRDNSLGSASSYVTPILPWVREVRLVRAAVAIANEGAVRALSPHAYDVGAASELTIWCSCLERQSGHWACERPHSLRARGGVRVGRQRHFMPQTGTARRGVSSAACVRRAGTFRLRRSGLRRRGLGGIPVDVPPWGNQQRLGQRGRVRGRTYEDGEQGRFVCCVRYVEWRDMDANGSANETRELAASMRLGRDVPERVATGVE